MKLIFQLFVLSTMTASAAILLAVMDRAGISGSGAASIIPIRRESVSFSGRGRLQHFYEPKPGGNDPFASKPDWLDAELSNVINSDFLHERFEYSAVKPPDTFRIITLGDSFTYGIFVSTAENFSETLEDMLNTKLSCVSPKKFEVINLGVYGYDIEYAVERFGTRGVKYEADLVVWLLHYGNFYKIQDLIAERAEQYAGDNIEAADKARREILKEMGEEKILQHQESALRSITEYYNGKLFVYSPANGLWGEPKKAVENFARDRANTSFFAGYADLKKIDGAVLPDGHPSQKGHAVIAEELHQYLLKNKVIPCEK